MWYPDLPIIYHDCYQVAWLLRHGANIKCDKYGKTPMSDAAENKQIEVSTLSSILGKDITV